MNKGMPRSEGSFEAWKGKAMILSSSLQKKHISVDALVLTH